jgi:hypothetical protein
VLSERKKVTSVKRRYNTIFLIAALVLIPMILGLIPLNLGQRLASGAPLSPVKPILKCNPCFFHSVTSQSHQEPAGVGVIQFSFTPRPAVFLIPVITDGEVVPSVLPDISPLRC